MKRYATYKEVCEEIKKVFAAKGYKNNRMNFTYDMKEYLLVVSFYKSRWGGEMYGDLGLFFYEMHPNGLEHNTAPWSDFQHRIFDTKYDSDVDIEIMREKLLNSLKICDDIVEKGAWKLFKENELRRGMYSRETVSFIYEKTGVKLQ